MPFCNKCGEELDSDEEFCHNCGAKSKNYKGTDKTTKTPNKSNLIDTIVGKPKLLLLLIVAIILIAVVGFTMLGGGKTVVLDGVDFNIPNGFEEVSSSDVGMSAPSNTYLKAYVNDKGDFVSVSVSQDSGYSQQDITNAINSGRFTAKNINGYDGASWIGEYGYAFLYIKNGKTATVYTNDESFLSQLVK